MSEPIETFSDEDFAAADYVLGTLSARERASVEARIGSDAAFRAEVEDWQRRLGPLSGAVSPVSPPPGLWRSIEASLPVAVASAPALARSARKLVTAFWRSLALGSSALAAASIALLAWLAVPLAVPGGGPATLPAFQLAASIASDEGLPLFAVVLDPATSSATLVPLRLEAEPGQVPELWLVRDGAVPQSLGLLDAAAPLRLTLPPETISGDLTGGVLAISLEPDGGSPTGQPTGPVVGHGDLRSI